jgi:hypothetical protein
MHARLARQPVERPPQDVARTEIPGRALRGLDVSGSGTRNTSPTVPKVVI